MASVAIGVSVASSPQAAATESPGANWGLPEQGQIEAAEVPEGTDVVECDLVGRQLDLGDAVLPIPGPGEGVGISGDSPTGDNVEATVETALDGTLTYSDDASLPAGAPTSPYNSNACDSNYQGAIKSWKLSGSWGISIGDGGQPAGGTQAQTAGALNAAGSTWTNETSPCYSQDLSRAPLVQSLGTTTYESDMQIVDGKSTCAARDGVSTLDAGNLDGGYVGLNCTWYDGSGFVIESDIRLNTTDYSFTYTPGSGCTSQYDVESVITHEVGHTLGLKDKGGAENAYQTMYESSFRCKSFARNLGKSDVWHLRARYPW
jgi:hypothetical protein